MHCHAIGHTTNPTTSDYVMLLSALPAPSHAIGLRGTDWSVHLKMDLSMNVQLKKLTKKCLQQNEGHLPLIPYCTNQRNKCLYSFLFSPTDCR